MKRFLLCVALFVCACDGEEAAEQLTVVQDAETTPDVESASPLNSGWCVSNDPIELGQDNLFDACQDPALLATPCGGRVNMLVIGGSGNPGDGLDVDGNSSTCAPSANCSEGIDNQLSILSSAAQDGVDEALASGTLMLFLEFVSPPGGPGVFAMKMHVARIDETDESCEWQEEVCLYRIRQDSYDDACTAPVVFDDVTVDEEGNFRAGEEGVEISLNIPLFGVSVSLPVRKARLEGVISWDNSGLVEGMEGLLVGGIPKAALVEAIDGIPAEEFEAGTSLDKATILAVIEDLIVNDLDLDGDGVFESASFGARVGAIPGVLAGWE